MFEKEKAYALHCLLSIIQGLNGRWIAPELIRGQEAREASDVWSFGMVVLELMTGECGFLSFFVLCAVVQGAWGREEEGRQERSK